MPCSNMRVLACAPCHWTRSRGQRCLSSLVRDVGACASSRRVTRQKWTATVVTSVDSSGMSRKTVNPRSRLSRHLRGRRPSRKASGRSSLSSSRAARASRAVQPRAWFTRASRLSHRPAHHHRKSSETSSESSSSGMFPMAIAATAAKRSPRGPAFRASYKASPERDGIYPSQNVTFKRPSANAATSVHETRGAWG